MQTGQTQLFPRKHFFLLLLLGFISNVYSQQLPFQLSKDAQIILLTVSPGDELYSAFGHSALRVFDPQNDIDTVFNYGAFQFEPTFEFYWRFIKGKLNYMLSVSPYEFFLKEYRYYNRSVVQQYLKLTDGQKNTIYQFLLENSLPQNRIYKYDFFYDNCSTRIRDIFERELRKDITFYPAGNKSDKTYRALVSQYLLSKPWVDLGINLILGYQADKQATGRSQMFLPDYLMSAFDSAIVVANDKYLPFVEKKEMVLKREAGNLSIYPRWCNQSSIVMWLIFLPLLIISFADMFKRRHTKYVDYVVYTVAGVLGLFFLFCWFVTDYVVLSWNFNLFWAFPGHITMMLLISDARRKLWIRQYSLFFSVLAMLVLIGWSWLPQTLHIAIVPFLILIALRGIVIYRYVIT